MDDETRERIALFRDELELCGVRAGERVVVLTEGEQLRDYADSFLCAARELGADVRQLRRAARGRALRVEFILRRREGAGG